MPVRIVWFNQILRVDDHPALLAAAAQGAVLPVFILDPEVPAGDHDGFSGGAKRWWLHGALSALGADLARLGSPLLIRTGPSAEVLEALCRESRARGLDLTRPLDPLGRHRLERVRSRLPGLDIRVHPGVTLFEPEAIRTRSGAPYQVFTPFWEALRAHGEPPLPLPPPERLVKPEADLAGCLVSDLGWRPVSPDWASGLRRTWEPGSRAGREGLARFLADALARYPDDRDFPAVDGTSRLSPYLASGELSVREAWHAVRRAQDAGAVSMAPADAWLRQLAWREFAWHLLEAYPSMRERPLRPQYEAFPWREDPADFRAWTRGRTGYPIVDAGMRQLWETGWMPNRVRMIAASFLVKHLLLPWQDGARYFEDTLVDADLACNAFGWQWVAGSGADGAPYFRIFNPTAQAERFDPRGDYIARWVPELAVLPPEWRHQPWKAPPLLRGEYPPPRVDHAQARERALAAFARVRDPRSAKA